MGVKDASRMVRIYSYLKNPPQGLSPYRGFSPAEWRYLTQNARTMSGMFLDRGEGGLHLDNVKVHAEYVTGAFFQVLQVQMGLGRSFLPDEDRVESPEALAVISYAFWQTHFGSDPGVISRRVLLEGVPFTIVGVTPREFSGVSIDRTDLWVPMSSMALLHPKEAWTNEFLRGRTSCCAELAGRLAPGVTRAQASSELSVLIANYAAQNQGRSDGVVLTGTPFLQGPGHKTREIFAIFGLMFLGVMLVLLLACANVGNLLLARAAARRKEIGIRLSLGAGRWRLIRQFLTESLVLACAAGALGTWLAQIVSGPIFRQAVDDATFQFDLDLAVLGYTFGLTLVACIAFGLAPALHATREDLAEAIKDRQSVIGPRFALRSVLLAVQVAVSVILLVSAGLLVRGVQHVRGQDPGFAVQGNAVIRFDFPNAAKRAAGMNSFFQEMADGLEGLPGAKPFGLADTAPLEGSRHYIGARLPHESVDQTKLVLSNSVTAGYFDVLRIPIVAGRNFVMEDAGRNVVLVNQALAGRFFPGESPIGKTIVQGNKQFTIAGMVRNAHTWGLDDIDAVLYTPISYNEPPRLIVPYSPANLAAVQALAKRLDAHVQVQLTMLSSNLDNWLSGSRAAAMIAGMLGLLALTLAAIGVSGVFAYAVQQRKREIGIRMALGARSRHVTSAVLGSAARALILGMTAGFAGAIAASRLIQEYIYGLDRLDPITYAGVFVVLAAAGLLATYLPARRAIRLDPVQALRCE